MNEQWKRELDILAESIGMCESYFLTLKNKVTNKKDAIRLYKAGIDWALEYNYPGIDFIRAHFSKRELESMGIYVDREFHGEVINGHIVQVFHNCTGSIRVSMNYDKIIIPTLYLASGSDMNVTVDKDIDIPVFIFDDSKINVTGKWVLKKVNLQRYKKNGELEKQNY